MARQVGVGRRRNPTPTAKPELPYDLDAEIVELARILNDPLDRLQAIADRPIPQPDREADIQAHVDLCQELEREWVTAGHLHAQIARMEDLAHGTKRLLVDLARVAATVARPELQAREAS